ncbi:MAG: type II secretion system protein N [Pseudomonadota bacterium]
MAGTLPKIPGSAVALGRTTLEIALVSALAMTAARGAWFIISPDSVIPVSDRSLSVGPITTQQAGTAIADRTVLTTSNQFARGAVIVEAPPSDDVLNAPETKLNLTLTGMRATSADGRAGSAYIVTPTGEQVLVQVGSEIIDGVLLEGVFSDRVAIRSRGDLESLRMRDGVEPLVLTPVRPDDGLQTVAVLDASNADAASARAGQRRPAGPPDPVVADLSSARQLLSAVRLSPVREGNTVRGFQISASGDVSTLLDYGLRPGDVLTAVNGRSLSGQNLQQLQALFQQARQLELRLEREDEEVVVSITLAEES